MQVSVSGLRKYLQCPRSFKLSEIDGIEPEYKSLSYCRGIAVKECISILHSEKQRICNYTKQEVYGLCEYIWEQTVRDEKVRKEELETVVVQAKKATKSKSAVCAITKGERLLSNMQKWLFSYSQEEIDAKILYTSVYFQTIIGDITFLGYIDMIREVDGVLEVVVFSSSQQAPDMAYGVRNFMNSLFAHAVLFGKVFPSYPDLGVVVEIKKLPKVLLYHLPHMEEKNKQHVWDVSRTREELLRFEYELLYVVSGMQNEFFPMFPRSVCGCYLCPYEKICKDHFIFAANVSCKTLESLEEKAKELV